MSDDRWENQGQPVPPKRELTEADFPFDASLTPLDRSNLRGLNRLRAVEDRGTAACLFDLYQVVYPSLEHNLGG